MVDLTQFNTMLTEVESEIACSNRFTAWEQKFVADLREHFDGREDQSDLGITMWTPTRNQYNTLHGIWSKL